MNCAEVTVTAEVAPKGRITLCVPLLFFCQRNVLPLARVNRYGPAFCAETRGFVGDNESIGAVGGRVRSWYDVRRG